ncbi:hypothetical protein O3G_MSEX004647 [Manduca sexta]|uniref:Reverse transcriptase domain-containing protein n=1 Tax=Manduca sexta TaxID=7130 RepID=A0A922CIK8_MANSE|nr:hypothetical protein O3G_MSEX004647 [Manduca sexta]
MAAIKCYYQNVRGLRTKTCSVFRNVCLEDYDVIAFTETWLDDNIFSNELFDGRYLVWRRDRDYSRTAQKLGGGVLIAVKSTFTVIERTDWHSSAEDIWVSLVLKRSRPQVSYNLHICVLYLCNENLGNSYITQLNNFTNKLNQLTLKYPMDKFILMGDFNFGNDVCWTLNVDNENGELIPQIISHQHIREFFDTAQISNLSQFNGERNINGRLLDLVFSNDLVTVSECAYPLAVPVDLHHKPLIIQENFVKIHKLSEKKLQTYIYSRGDYEAIKSELDRINWNNLCLVGTLDDAVTKFYNKLYELRDKYIPLKSMKQSSYPAWYNSALIKILKEKHKYHKKFKIYGNNADYHSFSILRNRAVSIEKTCFNKYMDKIENSIVKDPKKFWSYVKSKRNSNTFPNVMHYGDVLASTGLEISNLFATYFHSTFQKPDSVVLDVNVPLSNVSSSSEITSINTINVCQSRVLKLLKSLDLSKSGGPDFIPPIFIVNCADSIVVPLCILFQRSLSEGLLPNIWKSSFVTPVFKKGNRSDITNYRPISKICLFSKVLERLVHTEVYAALQCSYGDEQHGFLKKRSTTTNLILSHDFISHGMEKCPQIDVIYTDYSKCFDLIDHKLLLDKLFLAGIHGDLYRWFSSYIDNRTQAVVLYGYTSDWIHVPSGVPQGSILGPLLFTLFISDVKNCFQHSYILLYADDMKVHKKVQNIFDTLYLQEDLNRFELYCIKNKLKLNIDKCFHITFTRRQSIIGSSYKLNNQSIAKVNSIRDLGIIQDSKLLFDQHVDNIVKKLLSLLDLS